MRKTVKLALEHDVAIGAHPGLPDLAGFGRRAMAITPQEAKDLITYQIGALAAFVRSEGAQLQHVKPHGALYNMAAQDPLLATAIAEAVYEFDPSLILFGLAGSALIEAGEKIGIRTANEVFADRTYLADGSLTPRDRLDSLITDPVESARRVFRMIAEGKVVSQEGGDLSVRADTVCIHGDGPGALETARTLHSTLAEAGVAVRAVGSGDEAG
jgi:UPF0271 protein